MRFPCEIVVREFLPALRGSIARRLIKEHGFTQTTAALMLGVSQPSINYYLTQKRGRQDLPVAKMEDIEDMASKIANGLATGDKTQIKALEEVCTMCSGLRQRGPLCQLHEAMMPTIKGLGCKACSDSLSSPSE